MSGIKLTQHDIDYLNANARNATAVKNYLASRGLSDSQLGADKTKQQQNINFLEKHLGQYAVSYQASHDLYFTVSYAIKSKNGGKIPLIYKSTIKKYYDLWKEQSKGYWILTLIDTLSKEKILDDHGNVILPKFNGVNMDESLGAVSLGLAVIIAVAATVVISVIAIHLINSWKQARVHSKACDTITKLAQQYANGQISYQAYKDSLNAIVDISKQESSSSFFKGILFKGLITGVIALGGYAGYQYYVKGKSLSEIIPLKKIMGKTTKGLVGSETAQAVVKNSAGSIANKVIDKYVIGSRGL